MAQRSLAVTRDVTVRNRKMPRSTATRCAAWVLGLVLVSWTGWASLDEALTGDTSHLRAPVEQLDATLRAEIERDLAPWSGSTYALSAMRHRVRASGGVLMLWRLRSGALTLIEGGGRDLQREIGADRVVPFICLMRRILRRKRDFRTTYILLNVLDQPLANCAARSAACDRLALRDGAAHSFLRWRSPNGAESIRRVPSAGASPHVPVFSFAKIPSCYDDILIPYGQLLHRERGSSGDGLADGPAWAEKAPRVCWRGGAAGLVHRERLLAAAAALNLSALAVVDVSASASEPASAAWRSHATQQSMCRAFIDVDGHSYSKRLAWYLRGASTIVRGTIFDDVLSRLLRADAPTDAHPTAALLSSATAANNGAAAPTFDLLNTSDVRRALREAARAVVAPPESVLRRRYARAARRSRAIGERYARPGRELWDRYWLHLLTRYADLVAIDEEGDDAGGAAAFVAPALQLVPGLPAHFWSFWNWPGLVCGYSLFVDVRGNGAAPGLALRLPALLSRDGLFLAAAAASASRCSTVHCIYRYISYESCSHNLTRSPLTYLTGSRRRAAWAALRADALVPRHVRTQMLHRRAASLRPGPLGVRLRRQKSASRGGGGSTTHETRTQLKEDSHNRKNVTTS